MWDKISREERIRLIRKGVSEGLSASEIAARIGGCTRNAVIGLAERAKVPLRSKITLAPLVGNIETPPPPPAKPKEKPINPRLPAKSQLGPAALEAQRRLVDRRTVKPAVVTDEDALFEKDDRPAVVISDMKEPEPLKLSMAELTDKVCRFPIGDPQHADFYFCGNPTGGIPPYCKYHARKTHTSAAALRQRKK